MHTKRRIAVLTTGRSDYGLLYWTLKLIDSDPDLELGLIVTGMHLSKKLGFSLRDIENDNFPIAQKITTLGESDSKESIGASIGQGTVRYCEALSNMKPDIIRTWQIYKRTNLNTFKCHICSPEVQGFEPWNPCSMQF